MKLIYRGSTYDDYNPAKGAAHYPFQRTRTSKSSYELIYRGNTYRVDPNAIASSTAPPVAYELIYRGATYWVNRNEQGEVIAIAPTCTPFQKIGLKSIFAHFMADVARFIAN